MVSSRFLVVFAVVAFVSSCVRRAPPSAPDAEAVVPPSGLPSLEVDPDLPDRRDGPWLDASLPVEERLRLLLPELTENEKLMLVFGYYGADASWKGTTAPKEAREASAGYVPGISRLGIPPQWQTDAAMGVATQATTREPRERTALPSGLATAATWNPELAERGGVMIGAEARASGFNVMLAGSVNLLRSAYCGRNFEYAGEDPLLAGTVVGAQIAGVQSNHIISTIKHFAFNDQETDRNAVDVVIDAQAARHSDLLAFELAIDRGHPGAVMCAYNKVGGDWSCEHEELLTRILRDDWGYPGFVLSDWGAVHSTRKAALSGLEQQTGWPLDTARFFQAPLKQAIVDGTVPSARLDEMVARILSSLFVHGLFDHPVAEGGSIDHEAHGQISQSVAEEGTVLLKNDRSVLPLSQEPQTIAVIGGHALRGVLSGGGSSQVYPVGGNAVPGIEPTTWPGPVVYFPSSPALELKRLLPAAKVHFHDGLEVQGAVALARKADVAIVFATHWTTESIDTTLTLPRNQDALIAEVARAQPRTVVVLETGSVNLLPWNEAVSAIVHAWYPGTSGGRAIARLLVGHVNPSGHLPLTIPRSAGQLAHPDPPQPVRVEYHEGALVGYKWFDAQGHEPLYPFGHGLSYTEFQMSNLQAQTVGGLVEVSFDVKNVGTRAGKDVAQIYVAHESWAAPRRLGGFRKVDLQPGQAERVVLRVDRRVLSNWDVSRREWMHATGRLDVSLGSSSRELVERVSLELSAED